MHPAYQKIIGMSPWWFPCSWRIGNQSGQLVLGMRAITEEDPVAEACRGDGEAMARAWLKWGKERGYQW